jgi:hypothetical protein
MQERVRNYFNAKRKMDSKPALGIKYIQDSIIAIIVWTVSNVMDSVLDN